MRKTIPGLAAAAIIASCSTSKNPNDPYELINRKIFAANMAADHYVLRPITVGYTYIPQPLRYAISNFYNNLRDFVTLANNILQLDGINAMHNIMRISLNSTIGILGLIDISSSMGLPQNQTNFGATFKRWGWTKSSYLVFPLLGPGTIRDDLGLIPDIYFNPVFYIFDDQFISWGIFALNLLDKRSRFLDQDKLLLSTLDPYATIRDMYLQKNGEYIYTAESSINLDEDVDAMIAAENGESTPIQQHQSAADQEIDDLIKQENQLPK
jgi:phospholipid-binding lipoprotein MlaA